MGVARLHMSGFLARMGTLAHVWVTRWSGHACGCLDFLLSAARFNVLDFLQPLARYPNLGCFRLMGHALC